MSGLKGRAKQFMDDEKIVKGKEKEPLSQLNVL